MEEKSTRKSKSAGKAPPFWRFQFTPRAAALAGRIADAMTAHFRPSGEEGGAFTSAAVIDEAIGKGLACMAVQYLHDADALNPGAPQHLVNVVSVGPPLPLPITAERETAIPNVQRFELDALIGREIEELRTRVARLETMAAEVVTRGHARRKERR